jgi:cell division protein FtsB
MKVRRRVTRNAGFLIVPAICCAITIYFGYAGIAGPRGLLAWNETEAHLAIAARDLDEIRAERLALEHRIHLLDEDALDPDMLEEVARGVLSQGRAGEVAIPREKQ